MAIKKMAMHREHYTALVADTKPTGVPYGSTLETYDVTGFLVARYVTYDGDSWVVDPVGEVQTTPTSNTILARLKALLTGTVLAAGTAAIGKLAANSGVDIGDVDEAPVAGAAADIHAPAANTAAVVTYAASATLKHVITGMTWSYVGGIPVGGNLKVEDVSGTTVFTMDISEEGAGIIVFPKPKKGAAVNTAMIVTLAAGGAAVTGKVSVLNHYTEA